MITFLVYTPTWLRNYLIYLPVVFPSCPVCVPVIRRKLSVSKKNHKIFKLFSITLIFFFTFEYRFSIENMGIPVNTHVQSSSLKA